MGKVKTRSNGEGTIYNNGTRWVGQITIGRDPNTGKIKRKSVYGKTQREVKEKMSDIQSKLSTNSYIEESDLTLGEWAKTWLEDYKRNNISETTYTAYNYHITNHIINKIGYIKLKNLKAWDIQQVLNNMKDDDISGSFIWWIYNKFDMILKQAVKLEMIYKNPCEGVIIPKSRPKMDRKALTVDEQKLLVDYCSKDMKNYLFIFQLGTGMRIGETLGLPWKNVDFENNTIRIAQIAAEVKGKAFIKESAKTESSIRTIPMSEKIKNLLLEIKSTQDSTRNIHNLVFPTGNYTIKSQANVRRTFDKICENCMINKHTIHELRHTFATRMLEQNINIKVLSELMGHKNIYITMNTYSHVLDDLKKDSINAIDSFI